MGESEKIEVKLFLKKSVSTKNVGGTKKELFTLVGVDKDGKEYCIDSHLYCAGDAWGTVAYEEKN